MACTDDAPSCRFRFHFDDIDMSADAARPQDGVISRLENAKWVIEHVYIPFQHTAWHPIGCTKTHAFAVLQTDEGYTPIVMKLSYSTMLRPSQCITCREEFVSPWTKHPEVFSNFLGGCAYLNVMCMVLANGVLIFDSNWHVHMRDRIALQEVISCCMNNDFLVVVGVEAGKQTQSIFIYKVNVDAPYRILYNRDIQPNVLTVQLLNYNTNALIIQCENGRTRRLLIEERDTIPRYRIREYDDLVTGRNTQQCQMTKELSESHRIAKLIGKDVVLIKSKDDIKRSAFLDHMIVDVIDYADGVVVCQDSTNSINFLSEDLYKIVSVPWDHIAAAPLLYENGIPSILKPYPSLSLCTDRPEIVAFLASFGALVTIKML